MARMTQRRKIHRFRLDAADTERSVRFKEDVLAAEEPLEIRIGGTSFAVTMRTPGDDFDLVAGFLVSEGIIRSPSELISLRFCAGEKDGVQTFNVVEAQLRPDVPPLPDTMRHVYTSSSCGICGTDSIEAVRKTIHFDTSLDRLQVPVDVLAELPDRLREAQASSTEPEESTQLDCSKWMAPARSCCVCGKTSAGTMRGQSGGLGPSAGPAALDRPRPSGLGQGIVRTRPEGSLGRHTGSRGRQRPLQPRRRSCHRDRGDPGWLQPGT